MAEGVGSRAILACVCVSVCLHACAVFWPVPSPFAPFCALGELELISALSADTSRNKLSHD